MPPTLEQIGALAVAWHQARLAFDAAFEEAMLHPRKRYEPERLTFIQAERTLKEALQAHAEAQPAAGLAEEKAL